MPSPLRGWDCCQRPERYARSARASRIFWLGRLAMGLVEGADTDPAAPGQLVVALAGFVFGRRPTVHRAEQVHQLQGPPDGHGRIRPGLAAFLSLLPFNGLPPRHHAAHVFRVSRRHGWKEALRHDGSLTWIHRARRLLGRRRERPRKNDNEWTRDEIERTRHEIGRTRDEIDRTRGPIESTAIQSNGAGINASAPEFRSAAPGIRTSALDSSSSPSNWILADRKSNRVHLNSFSTGSNSNRGHRDSDRVDSKPRRVRSSPTRVDSKPCRVHRDPIEWTRSLVGCAQVQLGSTRSLFGCAQVQFEST